MPRVPTYDSAQVSPEALPAYREQALPADVFFNAQQGQLGRSMEHTGAEIGAVVDRKQREDNLYAVNSAETEYQERLLGWKTNELSKLKGAAASGALDSFNQWHDKTVQGIQANLGNDDQRKVFWQMAARQHASTGESVNTYAQSQIEGAQNQTFSDKIKVLSNGAVNAITDAEAQDYKQKLQIAIREQATVQNWTARFGPEHQAATEAAAISGFHADRINGILASGDAAGAAAYFKKYGDEITDGDTRAKVEKVVNANSATLKGFNTAQDIYARLGPKDPSDLGNLEAMEKEVNTTLAGDPAARESALRTLRENVSAHRDQVSQTVTKSTNAVTDAITKGASWKKVVSMPEYAALVSAGRNSEIDKYYDDRQQQIQSRSWALEGHLAAQESRQLNAEIRADREKSITMQAAYYDYAQPDVLAGMTLPQVQSLQPALGHELAGRLMAEKQRLDTMGLSSARIDTDIFTNAAAQLGLHPELTGNNQTHKAELQQLKFKLDDAVAAEQKNRGRPLTLEEKKSLATSVISDTIVQPTWFGYGSKKLPAATLSIKDVPTDFVDKARAAAAKHGAIATEESILRAYLADPSTKHVVQ